MRAFILILLSIFLIFSPVTVNAMDFTAPEVPKHAQEYMPQDTESFGDGLWSIIKKGLQIVSPSLADTAGICLSLIGISVLLSCAKTVSGTTAKTINLIGTIIVSTVLLQSSHTLIHLGIETVSELSDYGNLLIPVMSGAMAAQGRFTSSTALYTGTVIFSAILSSAISKLLAPMLYIFLLFSVTHAATGDIMCGKLRDFIKWLSTWGLKISLYIFTGYMGITGVVSGSADAARLKATKLTISGMVPVVGSILSDASESILVGAGIMKSSVGVYGLLAILALWIEPFLKIGLQYILLKATAAVCETFEVKETTNVIKSFATAMGLVLAMTGAVCLMLLISLVCFMKDVT